MTRQEFLAHCKGAFGAEADYPFEKDFETAVLRHRDNRKWFALVMRVPRRKLGGKQAGADGAEARGGFSGGFSGGAPGEAPGGETPGGEVVDVVNLKLPTELFGSFGAAEGVYSAYHMNKLHWISVLLAEAPTDLVEFLVSVSFEATKRKKRRGEKL
ncbi:MAG: MmcQ/YjbR family DNA-binding protein [Clostridia bacterium]|nr:MmcQ/YjbR family DNA-binding protein [Clostridia bacterium]